jgi:hypothetical protein
MTDEEISQLKVDLLNAQADAKYWRERCQKYENHHHRLETSAADIKGKVEQFLTVLQHARPRGTDKVA